MTGAGSSTLTDNNHLTDFLVRDQNITTPEIEKVFRLVDRANYFLPEYKVNPYKLGAWKHGNIHLSSPRIYARVMEHLRLSPSLSFLNIGSGTGYLSTMVGLILGPCGVNHGVEIHADVIDYANKKLTEFKTNIPILNFLEFCEPVFIKGNGLCLAEDTCRYDRVYCGATCPDNYENYMKNLIKVGGVLVMPLKDELLQITRVSNTQWEKKKIAGVVFSPLQVPTVADMQTPIRLPKINVSLPAVAARQNTAGPNQSPRRDVAKSSQREPKLLISSSSEEDEEDSSSSEEDKEHEVELLENIKKITGRLQELSECPVCFCAMDSTLIQCKNGHGICSSCALKIDKCPICKREFAVYHSTLLGKILESLPKTCTYIDKGCSVIALDKHHDTFCKFRPSSCRNTLCGWSGCVKDLIRHVRTCKKGKICEISSNATIPQYFAIDSTQNMFFYAPIYFQNQLFWEYFHRDVTTKRISFRFYHVATSKPTKSYYFKVSFKKGKIEYTNSFRSCLDVEDEEPNNHETGTILPDAELERFRSTKESGKYEYSVEVIIENTV